MIRKRKKFNKPKSRFYRINIAITAHELRVLDEKGTQVGILSRDDALAEARNRGVDLVEVAPKAQPPVARLIDFSKFKYLENKKKQAEKRSQKNVETKEVRLSPVIGQHDFDTRLEQVREFLKDNNPVKISIRFKGRMITRKQFGYDVLNRFLGELDSIKVVHEPKFEGKVLVAHIVRNKDKDSKSNTTKVK